MSIKDLIEQLSTKPETVEFDQVMAVINDNYQYTATRFTNGPDVVNEAGTNEGSCKIFSFAKLQELTPPQTLACFGKYYREDVLQNPNGSDHGNIRSFIKNGWDGIKFDGEALTKY